MFHCRLCRDPDMSHEPPNVLMGGNAGMKRAEYINQTFAIASPNRMTVGDVYHRHATYPPLTSPPQINRVTNPGRKRITVRLY